MPAGSFLSFLCLINALSLELFFKYLLMLSVDEHVCEMSLLATAFWIRADGFSTQMGVFDSSTQTGVVFFGFLCVIE